MLDLPQYEKLHSKGLISDKEVAFYRKLFMSNKPYTPYNEYVNVENNAKDK